MLLSSPPGGGERQVLALGLYHCVAVGEWKYVGNPHGGGKLWIVGYRMHPLGKGRPGVGFGLQSLRGLLGKRFGTTPKDIVLAPHIRPQISRCILLEDLK